MSDSKEPSAVGIYDKLDSAERTIEELRQAGFAPDEIGIMGHVGGGDTVPTPPETHNPEDNALLGFVRGAAVGAVVGGLVILVIPGLGDVAGFGRWFELLGGVALGALVCGLLAAYGSFIFMTSATRLYANELKRGSFIVTVKNPARKKEAEAVLSHQGHLAK